MEGKKKYIALVLFLLICLMVFTFASSGEEELDTGKGNGGNVQEVTGNDSEDKDVTTDETDEDEVDVDTDEDKESNSSSNNSSSKKEDKENNEGTGNTSNEDNNQAYLDALAAVEKLEEVLTDEQAEIARDLVDEIEGTDEYDDLITRIEDAEEAIDATALVEQLEKMVADALGKEDIYDAKDFRDDKVIEAINKIDGEYLAEVKQALLDRVETVNKILNDETAPTIEGLEGQYSNEDVTLVITDENEVTIIVTKDGKEIDFAETFTEEGTYNVKVIDAAFNGSEKIFTIDKTQPQITGVENGKYYNNDVTPVIVENNIEKVIVTLNGEEITYNVGDTLTEEGTYTIVVKDLVGYESETITFVIDKTPAGRVYSTIAEMDGKTFVTGEVANRKYYYMTNGDRFTFRMQFTEELSENPILTIGNYNVELTLNEKEYNKTGKVIYGGEFKIDEDEKDLLEGNLEIRISNVYDLAGNESTQELVVNQTVTSNNRTAIYDKTPNVVTETSLSTTKNEGKVYYVTNGDTIKFQIGFKEELPENPVVTIGGKEVTLAFDKYYTATKTYLYRGTLTIAEDETEMLEGTLDITITNVKDIAGNKGFRYQKNDTKVRESITTLVTTNGRSVVYDRTAPTAEVSKSNNDKSTNQDVTVTLTTNEDVTIEEGWTTVSSTEFTKVYSENGKYSVVITDKAGNATTVKFEVKRIDKVAPKAEYSLSNNGEKTNQDVTVTIVANEAIYKPEGWNEVKTNKEHEFTKVYSENGTYSVVITDKAGNQSTITFEVKDINKVFPELDGEILYNPTELTNKEVKVVVTFKKAVYTPAGWTMNGKARSYYKVYTENTTEEVEFTDLYGNKKTFTITVSNIDKEAPTVEFVGTIGKNQNEVYVNQGEKISLEDYVKATDNMDKNPTLEITKVLYFDHIVAGQKYDISNEINTNMLGRFNIYYIAKDSAGNVSEEKVLLVMVDDVTAPKITVKDSSIGKDGEYSNISFSLSDNDRIDYFTVNGVKYDRTNAPYSDANFANIKGSLVEGENTIVLYDRWKNTDTFTFVYDVTAPKVQGLTISGGNLVNENGVNNWYAGSKSNIYVYAVFNEKLDVVPTLVIEGKEYKMTSLLEKNGTYRYYTTAVKGEMLKEGLVNFEVKGYADKAGNVGKTLSNADITLDSQSRVYVDNTYPTITIKDSSKKNVVNYLTIDLKFYDANEVKKVVINGKKLSHTGYYVDINDGHAYTFKEGENKIEVTDKAGNTTTMTVIKDTSKYVTNEEELKEAFTNGGEFKLTKDLIIDAETASDWLTVPAGVKLTLDLNGKTISNTSTVKINKLIVVYGELTITGNGTLDATNTAYERIMQTEGNGRINALNGTYIGQITTYDSGVTALYGGTYRPVVYNPSDYFNNAKGTLNKTWDGGTLVVYGGTYEGMNPAWGDEGMAYGGPLYNPNADGYCQGLFLAGQRRKDTMLPQGYEIVEGTTTDGVPTYTVKYTKDTKAPKAANTSVSPETETDDIVTITIKLTETVKSVEDGWTLSEDRTSIYRVFKKNTSGTVEVTDLAGNKGKIDYAVTNIVTKKVSTEAELIEALKSKEKVALAADIEITKQFLVKEKTFTIDLNGHGLIFNNATTAFMTTSNGTIIIEGNGKIEDNGQPQALLAMIGDIIVKGGTYNYNPLTRETEVMGWGWMTTGKSGVAEGYTAIDNQDGTWTVVSK